MAAIVTSDQYIDYYNNPAGVTQGAIGSALAAGSVVGSLMAGPISDKIGRRDRYAAPFLITGLLARPRRVLTRGTVSCLLVYGGSWEPRSR